MASTWSDVWRAVDQRRTALGLSKAELYRRSGVSETTFRKMRNGHPLLRVENQVSVATALDWPPDSIARLLAGDAVHITQPADDPLAALRVQVAVMAKELAALQQDVALLGGAVVPTTRRAPRAAPRSPGGVQ